MNWRSIFLRLDSPLPLIAILALAFGIRAWNISYNTAFLDEAIYVVTGDRLLNGAPISNYGWLGGYPYFYPIFSTVVDGLGDLRTVRLANVIFGVGTVLIVFFLTRTLIGTTTGLFAAAVYGTSAAPITVSRLATYDAISAFFLSLAILLLVKGLQEHRPSLISIGALIGFYAFLVKYVAGFYLPFIGLVLCLHPRRRWAWKWFMIPLACLGALYVARFWSLLIWPFLSSQLLSKHGAYEAINAKIIETATTFLGSAMIPAAVGLTRKPSQRRLSLALVGGALLTLIYHFTYQTPQSLHKHAAYSLIFLAPVSGLGLHSLVNEGETGGRLAHCGTRTVASSLGTLAALVLMMLLWLRSWQGMFAWEKSWPSAERSVFYLSQTLKGDEVILAESRKVYEYYLQLREPRLQGLHIKDNFGWFAYEGRRGDEAILQAIDDGYFDFVVLDGGFTPKLDEKILPRLEGGYRLVFNDPPELDPGKGIICIFERTGNQAP